MQCSRGKKKNPKRAHTEQSLQPEEFKCRAFSLCIPDSTFTGCSLCTMHFQKNLSVQLNDKHLSINEKRSLCIHLGSTPNRVTEGKIKEFFLVSGLYILSYASQKLSVSSKILYVLTTRLQNWLLKLSLTAVLPLKLKLHYLIIF